MEIAKTIIPDRDAGCPEAGEEAMTAMNPMTDSRSPRKWEYAFSFSSDAVAERGSVIFAEIHSPIP